MDAKHLASKPYKCTVCNELYISQNQSPTETLRLTCLKYKHMLEKQLGVTGVFSALKLRVLLLHQETHVLGQSGVHVSTPHASAVYIYKYKALIFCFEVSRY